MKDRFTRTSRIGRGNIPRDMRESIYRRDSYTCQFCGLAFAPNNLTIDHLIPLSLGGLDEQTNYVTCCRACNQRKANQPLSDFARTINIDLEDLPVHGDPVIDNMALPIQIRLIRKRIFDKIRRGEVSVSGKQAQRKIEKIYRLEFWQTPEGKALEAEFPNLPGHVRIMIPEIQTIAKNTREYLLLLELAKSANTRNLIGAILTFECNVEERIKALEAKTKDISLKKRIGLALNRCESEVKRRNILSHIQTHDG